MSTRGLVRPDFFPLFMHAVQNDEFCFHVHCACASSRWELETCRLSSIEEGGQPRFLSLFLHAVQNDSFCSIMHGFYLHVNSIQHARCDLKIGRLYSIEEEKIRLDLLSVCARCSEWRISISFTCTTCNTCTCTTWIHFSMLDVIWRLVVFLL